MIKDKKIRKYYLIAVFLLFVAFLCRQVDLYFDESDAVEILISSTVVTLRNIIHISLMILWCASLYNRIIHDSARKFAMSGGILLTYWILARVCKNDFTVSNHEVVGRYLWYSYYIPMILVPLLGVYIVNYIDKPENYKTPLLQKLLLVPAGLLILGVMTNDLHQWVFSFPEGIINFEDIYNYEFLYVIVLSWIIISGAYFVIMLIKKSRVPESQELQAMPAVIFSLTVVFWILYCLRIVKCDLTTVDCIIIVLLVESAIQCNMLPSNNNYKEVLTTSNIAAKIVDKDYNKRIVSSTAMDLTVEQIKTAEKEKLRIGNIFINTRPIVGGYVVWQEDVTELSELLEQLQDTKNQLAEEHVLLQAELSVKERRAKTDEKNRLYDRIAKDVSVQLDMVSSMLRQIEKNEGDKEELMKRICVIGSYIKRRGNLLLLGEFDSMVEAMELDYSINESINNIKLMDVYTSFDSICIGSVKLKHMVEVYDLFERLVELMLDDITAIMVRLRMQNGDIKLNVQIGLASEMEEDLIKDVKVKYNSIDYDIQGEDIIINAEIKSEEEKYELS